MKATQLIARSTSRWLEELGLKMSEHVHTRSRHRLLMPQEMKLMPGKESLEYWADDASRHGYKLRPPDYYLQWMSLDALDLDEEESRECFWSFLRLPEMNVGEVLNFAQRWGVSPIGIFHNENDWKEPGNISVYQLREEAHDVRSLLLILTASEAGELVPEEALFSYRHLPNLDHPSVEHHDSDWVSSLEEIRSARRNGEGMRLQMKHAVERFADRMLRQGDSLIWDEKGHRFETPADGVFEIAWSHLQQLYATTRSDVYICSICGNPYPFDEIVSPRRPRAGSRSFCSDACRAIARRESNRGSWSRNGSRWRAAKRSEAME